MNRRTLHAALAALLALAPCAVATTLTTIPSPVAQGGMVHINTVFLDQASGTFDIHLDTGTPELKPLTLWKPGDTFDPSDPWYDELDPSQQGRLFSSRYGFLVDVGNSDPTPAGFSLGVRLVSASPGLAAYYYRGTSGSELFDEVFTPSHDYVLWSGVMWHPVFTASAPGNYSATFEFFVANATRSGDVDYSTVASPAAGYSTAQATLNFAAVPEPASALLVMAGAGALACLRRRPASRA
jgi:hypothetical protein